MQTILNDLRHNEELKKIRDEWEHKTDLEFPPFNFFEYTCIEQYIEKIKEKISTL